MQSIYLYLINAIQSMPKKVEKVEGMQEVFAKYGI